MPRSKKTSPRNPGWPLGFLKLKSAVAACILLSACLTPTTRADQPPDPMRGTPAEEGTLGIDQTLDEFLERVGDSRHRAWLMEFRRSFPDTDRFYIAEREDCFEITVSHLSSGGYTGGTEAYRLDKATGEIRMLWHEHPMKLPGIEEPEPRRDSVSGGGTDPESREFRIQGIKGSARVGGYEVQLLDVTLEVSDEGHAINLALRLSDSEGRTEDLLLSVPALTRTGEARCRFGVVVLLRVDDLDSNFYRTPENITWSFEFRPDERTSAADS